MVPTRLRDTYAEVSLEAVEHNVKAFQSILLDQTILMAVVKAGATYLGVATLDEAIALRNDGITAQILVLVYIAPSTILPLPFFQGM